MSDKRVKTEGVFAQFINIPVADPDLQIRGRGGGVVSQTLRKGGGGSLQFGLKLRGGGAGPSPGSTTAYAICTFPIMHLICPPPPPTPQILHNLFSFLLGITAIPCEIENNPYVIFFFLGGGKGQIRCIMGDV